MDKLKNALLETVPVALWVGVSAGVTYVLTALLDRPELAGFYGIINVLLFLIKELRK